MDLKERMGRRFPRGPFQDLLYPACVKVVVQIDIEFVDLIIFNIANINHIFILRLSIVCITLFAFSITSPLEFLW